MTKSRFAALADLHRERTADEPTPASEGEERSSSLVPESSSTPAPVPERTPEAEVTRTSTRQGRARGKSSSGEYQKTTILLHTDVYHAVQTKLLTVNRGKGVGEKKDMSDVVNDLLREWMNS
ncbi:hypothetical protein [Deinococcus pimensis]|uniref:hypothetical protein n=1 Tax=Deinococcus pimensis TaxID=309888 RepID=UPI000489AE6F|nr:hypothetical protein [Deinococcus pimensis]